MERRYLFSRSTHMLEKYQERMKPAVVAAELEVEVPFDWRGCCLAGGVEGMSMIGSVGSGRGLLTRLSA